MFLNNKNTRFRHFEDTKKKTMLKQFGKLQKVQTVRYKRKQVWMKGCIVIADNRKQYKEMVIKRLKYTHQIQLFVDRKKNKQLVSMQLPPAHPRIWIKEKNAITF
jgi:hypothetical protein